MKAMILAAGLGTRLRPLTDHRPKALVEIAGRSLLEITLSRLRAFGIHDVIINVHHLADMILEYLEANDNFGMHIAVSREEELLDTGGGLKRAAHFFLEGTNALDEPFVLHNVDVLSTIDLHSMVQSHKKNQALATLAVKDRESSRYLLFNDKLKLCGRQIGRIPKTPEAGSPQSLHALAFSGIHVISNRIFELMAEEGAFSIIDTYLRLASQREKILAFRADGYYWRDLGRLDDVQRAEQDLKNSELKSGSVPEPH